MKLLTSRFVSRMYRVRFCPPSTSTARCFSVEARACVKVPRAIKVSPMDLCAIFRPYDLDSCSVVQRQCWKPSLEQWEWTQRRRITHSSMIPRLSLLRHKRRRPTFWQRFSLRVATEVAFRSWGDARPASWQLNGRRSLRMTRIFPVCKCFDLRRLLILFKWSRLKRICEE